MKQAFQKLFLCIMLLLFVSVVVNFIPLYANETVSEDDNKSIQIKLEARIDVPLELNLERTLNIAVKQNLEIVQAEYGKAVQKWKLWENIGNFLPDYKLGLSDQRFSGNLIIGGVLPVMALASSANAYMRFDYPFFEGGKGFFSTLAAKKLYGSSKENLEGTLHNTLLDVTKAYNQLLSEQAQLDVLKKALEEARAEVKLNKDLEGQGAGTRFDVLQSEAQLAEQEQQYIAKQADLRKASINLARILHLEQGTVIKPDQNDLNVKELFSIDQPISGILSLAKENRPEIKKAGYEYGAQKNYVLAAYSDYLPRANFWGQYGGAGNVFFHRTKVSGVVPDAIALDANGAPIVQMVSRDRLSYQLFSPQVDLSNITTVSNIIRGAGKPFTTALDDSLMSNKSIGFQVDWLLGDGLGLPTASRINQARNQAKLLRTGLDILNQKIEQEVREAYLQVQTAQKLLNVANKRLNAATEALKLAKVRLENGVGINTEYLNAQKQYKESLSSQVDAVVGYNNAQAELLHHVGIISVETLLAKGKPVN